MFIFVRTLSCYFLALQMRHLVVIGLHFSTKFVFLEATMVLKNNFCSIHIERLGKQLMIRDFVQLKLTCCLSWLDGKRRFLQFENWLIFQIFS